jgi:hypothetical protein
MKKSQLHRLLPERGTYSGDWLVEQPDTRAVQ